MANKFTDTENYDAIAKSIRKCNGLTTKYYPSEMANAIANIPEKIKLTEYMGFRNSTMSTFDASIFERPIQWVSLFLGCNNITSIDLDPWPNHSGQKGFSNTFADCNLLTGVYNVHIKNLYLDRAFQRCPSLTNLNFFNSWDSTNIQLGYTYGQVFEDCTSLTDVSAINNSRFKLYDASGLFRKCSSLVNIDLSNCSVANSVNLSQSFQGCTSLQSVVLPSMNVSSLDSTFSLLYDTRPMTIVTLDLSNLNVSNCNRLYRTFFGCSSLTSLDTTGWNTSNVTNMDSTFYDDSSLTNLSINHWNTANVTNMSNMFFNCSGLTSLDLSNFSSVNLRNTSQMFFGCSRLTDLNLSGFTTTSASCNTRGMFDGCTSLQHLDIRNMDFSNITTYTNMFGNSSTGVPSNCEIIVKDQAAKDFILNQRPDFTNIVIA